MIGERTMNTAILRNPSAIRDPQPAFATAAPPMPPMRAWEDEVGSPRYQVIRSQAMAPTRPAKITDVVKTSGWTTPLAMVAATLVPKMRNAMKLKKAAHRTASLGVRTRVETTVAIEFAASWKPLKKSNDSATRMTKTRVGVIERRAAR